jgi:hypothetical protein
MMLRPELSQKPPWGPLLVGGLDDSGHRKWFFQLGRVF